MRFARVVVAILGFVLSAAAAQAQTSSAHQGHTPYAGHERREVKSLSDSDLAELRRGGGWGTALPAELSGYPGPAHLLELKDKIGLSADQIKAITTLHGKMQADAIAAGERLIAAEKALDAAFVAGGLTNERLRVLIGAAEAARAEVRYVHLSQHLATPPLLTEDQIALYNTLRGYGGDPCAAVPQGHDAAMWRRHNNCK